MLFALHEEHEARLGMAANDIRAGNASSALEHLDRADTIRKDPKASQLRALAELIRGRFDDAVELYLQLTRPENLSTSERGS